MVLADKTALVGLVVADVDVGVVAGRVVPGAEGTR